MGSYRLSEFMAVSELQVQNNISKHKVLRSRSRSLFLVEVVHVALICLEWYFNLNFATILSFRIILNISQHHHAIAHGIAWCIDGLWDWPHMHIYIYIYTFTCVCNSSGQTTPGIMTRDSPELRPWEVLPVWPSKLQLGPQRCLQEDHHPLSRKTMTAG